MKNLIVAALFAVSTITPVFAQDKPAPATPAQQAEYASTAQTARGLVAYGEAKGDALALVMAAKMVAGIPGQMKAEADGKESPATLDVEAVLKKAEELANGDEYITKVAADVRAANEANSRAYCVLWEVCDYYGCSYYWVC